VHLLASGRRPRRAGEAAIPKLAAILLSLVSLFAAGARADGIVSTDVEGTQLKVNLASGRLLRSPALVGAVLNLALPGGTTGRVRIEQVEKDGNSILYKGSH
jgi:hypothetical protein